jgi:predicted nuclease of predicted toxin-antitoxin system
VAAFYADENFPLQVVEALRRAGHDVLTAFEAGQANKRIPDEVVLAFATRSGRSVLTQNRWQFIALHARFPKHAGIVVCTWDPNVERMASAIHKAVSGTALSGVLIRINRPS